MRALIVALIVCVAVASAAPLSENEYQFLFSKWVNQHKKSYESVEEFFNRYNVWKTNMEYVVKHESNPERTHFLKMNEFGDLTNTEFRARFNKFVPSGAPRRFRNITAANLPTSVNWVAKGVVTGVKNQGQCGSCWAFSTTGSLEGASAIKTGKLVSLSEQELVDCSGSPNQGCNGGDMEAAFQWIQSNGGLCTESAYPYQGVGGTCQTSCSSVVTDTGYVAVTANDNDGLAAAVAQQPVSIAVDAGGLDWQFYSGGVLSDPNCGTQLDHGVLAAGYDTLNGTPYWLVKNSWGTSWGVSGYIYIKRDTGSSAGVCGIAMYASYPTV